MCCSAALEALAPRLQAKDVEERGAAGEAVALLFSMAELSRIDEGDSGDDLSGDQGGTLHDRLDAHTCPEHPTPGSP